MAVPGAVTVTGTEVTIAVPGVPVVIVVRIYRVVVWLGPGAVTVLV